jgi:tRNA 2-selenouridine synthase SelU
MSLNITLKIGETSKKETIQIENKHTGEIILVGLARIKGKQVRIRLIDDEHNFKVTRIPDTYVQAEKPYMPKITANFLSGIKGIE